MAKNTTAKKLILFLWQIPQNTIGHIISRKYNFLHSLNGRKIFHINKGEGMALGDYLFVRPECSEGNLLRHEYGHSIQSRMLGPLYMIIIFLPSYCWWLYFSNFKKQCPDSDYYKFYTEKWADKLMDAEK